MQKMIEATPQSERNCKVANCDRKQDSKDHFQVLTRMVEIGSVTPITVRDNHIRTETGIKIFQLLDD